MAQFGGSQSSEFVWKYLCVYCVSELRKKKKKKTVNGFLAHFHYANWPWTQHLLFTVSSTFFSQFSFFLSSLHLSPTSKWTSPPEHQMRPDWKIGTWWKWVWTKTVCFTAKIIGIAEQETMAVWIDVVGYMAMPLWALRHQVWYGFLAVGVPMGCGFGMRLLNMLWKPWKNQPWKLSQLPLLLQSFESSHDVLL